SLVLMDEDLYYVPRRGDHLYVWRKVRMYQHHGIVISAKDILEHVDARLHPIKIKPLMIIEQNKRGLGIVTLEEFRTEYPFNYMHDVGCARYGTDPMNYYLNRSGTCYLTARIEEDQIVENAIRIYNDERQRDIWKTYSLIVKNCEQFAFVCCTNVEYVLGEQVLLACNAVKCLFINGIYNAVKFSFQIIRGNALAALSAFTLEALILSVRLFIYYWYETDREKNLIRKVAITPENYVQQMIQAGVGSLAAFGLSIAAVWVGSTTFMVGATPMVCSIFFGFIGYLAARWLSGLLIVQVKKKLRNDEKTVMYKDQGDEEDRINFV
ncbi:unnamed protein product, partial [Didymodactylos carnosus]